MRSSRRGRPIRSSLAAAFAALASSSAGGIDDRAALATAFDLHKLEQIEAVLEKAVADETVPGAVFWLERGGVAFHVAVGSREVKPGREPMEIDTVFDLASLTKVVATAPSIVQLAEAGKLALGAPVSRYLPEFNGGGKDRITVEQLLTHTSGLRPGIPKDPPWTGYEEAIAKCCAEVTEARPGTRFRYSDINFILLGEIVRRVAGVPLDVYAREHIFEPLGMTNTSFQPPADRRARAAPTTLTDGVLLRGVVHDPTSQKMGGVAGHAGLFSTAEDVAKYARAILDEGRAPDGSILSPRWVRKMTSNRSPWRVREKRGLGWDIETAFSSPRGALFRAGSSFGHTGWTGTAVWIDPSSDTFFLLFANRNHPYERPSISDLRREVAALAAEAVGYLGNDEPQTAAAEHLRPRRLVPAARGDVLNGIDVLVRDEFAALDGKQVGLVTNQTGIARDRRTTIDLLAGAPNVDLLKLFSPEHGIRGVEETSVVDDTIDEKTGLPIVSLYKGADRKPTAADLDGLDALVFDIQDIGTRFYTYIATIKLCMEACSENGIELIVLDRVNPINGIDFDGPLPDGDRTFVACHDIPVRHGMTVGELAALFREESVPEAKLTVIPIEGWRRTMHFDETGLPWVNPSPNMRSLTQAILYPGVGLIEFADISVGRGTDTPFEIIGAPYVDDAELAETLSALALDGISFTPVTFTPEASKFTGQLCRGVQFTIHDRAAFRPLNTGIALAAALHHLYPDHFKLDKVNTLLVHPSSLAAIREEKSIAAVRELWDHDLDSFSARRTRHLAY